MNLTVENLAWILVLAVLLAACIFIWLLYRKIYTLEQRNNQLSESAQAMPKIVLSEESLRYKLDPHLLKNALNAIQSHAYHSYHALDKLSNVLDYILYESDDEFVKLKDEIAFAQNLIEINRLKVSPLFDLHIRKKIDKEAGELLIAPFITINAIENAFKHADVQSDSSFISVVFEVVDDTFLLSVSNKVQPAIHRKSQRGGLGNQAFRNRLDRLYPGNYKLIIEEKDGIYLVKLEIKLGGYA